jgi:hypothetical protein
MLGPPGLPEKRRTGRVTALGPATRDADVSTEVNNAFVEIVRVVEEIGFSGRTHLPLGTLIIERIRFIEPVGYIEVAR